MKDKDSIRPQANPDSGLALVAYNFSSPRIMLPQLDRINPRPYAQFLRCYLQMVHQLRYFAGVGYIRERAMTNEDHYNRLPPGRYPPQ
jgi:hypothetical protein